MTTVENAIDSEGRECQLGGDEARRSDIHRDVVITGLSDQIYDLQLTPTSKEEAVQIANSLLDYAIAEELRNRGIAV